MDFAAAHAELAQVLDAATQVAMIATDVDGTITLFNSGAEHMLGYAAEEMIGKRTPAVMHLASEVERRGEELSREFGRDVRGFEVFVAYAKAGKFERREWTYVRKDGRHLTVNLVVTAVRDAADEITGFLGVAEDISERKRSEEALRKSEERYNLAVAGSNDGIWDWDVRTNEVYYAPRFKELLGYCDAEFENTFLSFQMALHPNDRARTLARIRRHLEDREPYDAEYRLRTKSGEYRWFRARGQAIWDGSGQAVRMAGSLTDITERKQSEAALAQNAAEIQRANETLRIAEAEARNAVVKRDQFLAMLSHELRNPLSAILSGVGVLDHADADLQAVQRARQAIRRQVDHMSRLLDDLLDVARVTQGKIAFHKRVLDLNQLMSEAGQGMRTVMQASGHNFSIVPAEGAVMVDGDATRLLQIIENLLTNAAKYTPSGGCIMMRLVNEDDHCELRVRDNGRGIEPALLEDIFDMFFQSDHALDRGDGGMGVGLTLVRALVQMHLGTVTAHSEGLARGSEFVVRLPLASRPQLESRESTSPADGPATRILLVEDNGDTRDMLQTILQLDGFQVETAEDGQRGLEAILAERPDVAVIDIGLPQLDGYEVARRVRQQFGKSQIRLIALTGYGQQKDRAAVYAAGFDEHLVKPVDIEKLKQVLSGRPKPR
jgi:two-component system CheB/CheR fusion protein